MMEADPSTPDDPKTSGSPIMDTCSSGRQAWIWIAVLLVVMNSLALNDVTIHKHMASSQNHTAAIKSEVAVWHVGMNSSATVNHKDLHIASTKRNESLNWINTSAATISMIRGDPSKCQDVIYMVDSRDPFSVNKGDKDKEDGYGDEGISKVVESMSHIVHVSKAFQKTCFVFVQLSTPLLDDRGNKFHPVWGRLPATALVMQTFWNANVFLYMDTDALLTYSKWSPTSMYKMLAFDGHGENATMEQLQPGLIVNKPTTGWLCAQCENYKLGHGCFNSGALLWHRSKAAPILRAWWESRLGNESDNFVNDQGEGFYGWNTADRAGDKMGEQNRLMYVYGTNPRVRSLIWPVPRQKSEAFQSESCPNGVDENHVPCLQQDTAITAEWNPEGPQCLIRHMTDAKDAKDTKDVITQTAELLLRHSDS